jgi:hypothetical protein
LAIFAPWREEFGFELRVARYAAFGAEGEGERQVVGQMDITLTSKSVYRLTWADGHLDINLVPMNRDATCGTAVGYAAVRPDGVLSNSIADLVGIVGLGLNNCPSVPRICWDNREHQFWDGFEGAFEPRNVVVNSPSVDRIGSQGIKARFC